MLTGMTKRFLPYERTVLPLPSVPEPSGQAKQVQPCRHTAEGTVPCHALCPLAASGVSTFRRAPPTARSRLSSACGRFTRHGHVVTAAPFSNRESEAPWTGRNVHCTLRCLLIGQPLAVSAEGAIPAAAWPLTWTQCWSVLCCAVRHTMARSRGATKVRIINKSQFLFFLRVFPRIRKQQIQKADQ